MSLLAPAITGAAAFFAHRVAPAESLRSGVSVLDLEPVLGYPLAGSLALVALVALRSHRGRVYVLGLVVAAAVVARASHGPLLSPLTAVALLPRLLEVPGLRGWAVALAIEAASLLLVLVALGMALLRSTRRGSAAEVAYGTAAFATRDDLDRADLLSGEGLVLGLHRGAFGGQPVTDRSSDHALIVMPPGAGKTTGPIVSTLLNTLSPTLVLDPKGELWNLSAGWRRSQGQRVIRFAPHLGRETARWSPLGEIETGPGEVAAVGALADNLITYPAEGHGENHWTASARSLLRCLVLHVLYTRKIRGEAATMEHVRDLLTSERDLATLFRRLQQAEHAPAGAPGWIRRDEGEAAGASSRTHPEVVRLARAFEATPDRERGSVVSTLLRFLDLWGDPRIAAATSGSDWSLSLLADREPVTVYVTVPTNDLGRLAPLVRILVALLSFHVTREVRDFADQDAGRSDGSLMLVLDEFASLGRVPQLEDLLAFFRGYGARAVLAVQDFSQLRRLYGPHHGFSANCRLQVVSASSDVTTRQEISRRLGEATHVYRKVSRTGRLFTAKSTRSQAEVRRPLLTEGEVGTLDPDRLLVVKAGAAPVLAEKLPYWTHPVLKRRAAEAAPSFSDSAQPAAGGRGAG